MLSCPACSFQNHLGEEVCENCASPLHGAAGQAGDRDHHVEQRLRKMKIRDLNLIDPIIVGPDEPIDSCIVKMQQQHRAHVLICNAQRDLIGIVTERDLLYKVHPGSHPGATDIGDTPISSIMNTPQTLRGDDSVAVLINFMAVKGYRRVPITIDGGHSLITVRALFHTLLALADDGE